MRRNIVKQKLLDGEAVIGTMINEVTTPAIAQVFPSRWGSTIS